MLGKHELDEMLAERDKLNADIQEILDMQTEAWGVKVSNVEIKQVDLDHSMVRAIARQAEAERLRRAKIINAEGEQQAARNCVEAAEMLATSPGRCSCATCTLSEIASERKLDHRVPVPAGPDPDASGTGRHDLAEILKLSRASSGLPRDFVMSGVFARPLSWVCHVTSEVTHAI